MTAIAEYYAKVGFKVDQKSAQQMDRYLKRIEDRMSRFQGKLMSSFTPQQRPMIRSINNTLDEVSKKIVLRIRRFEVMRRPLIDEVRAAYRSASNNVHFQVSRFSVDRARLQRALMMASRNFAVNVNPSLRGGGGVPRPGYDATSRMELERLRHSQRMELERLRQQGSLARSAGFGAAAGTGLLGAHGTRLPGILGGAYLSTMAVRGVGNMNQYNQEVISTQLTTQAVTEAAGLQGQGPAAFNWLQRLGNNLGFNFMDQAQDYNSFLSNALGAGQSLGGAQGIYKGFAEYQRAMGITPARQKLVMSA